MGYSSEVGKMVYDPVVIFRFKRSHSSEGDQSADQEWTSSTYDVPPNEVLEIFKMEIIPPVKPTTGVIEKLKYATITINDDEYPTLHPNSVMYPLDDPRNPSIAVPLGIPYLHRPLIGRLPNPIEGACPKLNPGDKLGVKTVAAETIDQDYEIILYAARVRTVDKLREVLGASEIAVTITLNGDYYTKPNIPVALEHFNELPGGLKQEKPQIFTWATWATNKTATTANEWYTFDYPNHVDKQWQILYWNLVNKNAAYLVDRVGVIPADHSYQLRFWIEGRVTNPEYPIRPLPEFNYFPPAMFYDTSLNQTLKRSDLPRKLASSVLFHGVKGGIQIKDDGTSISANGVEIHVYGTKFVLR